MPGTPIRQEEYQANAPAPDKDRLEIEQAIGHFILDLGMIETTMIQALAILTDIDEARAHFLLNKTAGGAKAALLRDAAKAKGIDLKSTRVGEALGTIQSIMDFRNRLVHDAIAFSDESKKWMLGQGVPQGDRPFAKETELDPLMLSAMSQKAWAAIKTIGDQIMVKHGGWKQS